MTEQTSSVKLPTFDEKEKNFNMYWIKFKAYAVVKGFLPALQEGGEKDMPPNEEKDLDLADDAEKKHLAAKKRNAMAVASLTMSFNTESLITYATRKSCTEEWPGGLAYLIVKAHFKKYRPQDTITRVELRSMLNKVTMKTNDCPDKLFEQLSYIKNMAVRF